MVITALFVIVGNWEQPNVLLPWNKLLYIHTIEYFMEVKVNELQQKLILQIQCQKKRIHSSKRIFNMTPLTYFSKTGKSYLWCLEIRLLITIRARRVENKRSLLSLSGLLTSWECPLCGNSIEQYVMASAQHGSLGSGQATGLLRLIHGLPLRCSQTRGRSKCTDSKRRAKAIKVIDISGERMACLHVPISFSLLSLFPGFLLQLLAFPSMLLCWLDHP